MRLLGRIVRNGLRPPQMSETCQYVASVENFQLLSGKNYSNYGMQDLK